MEEYRDTGSYMETESADPTLRIEDRNIPVADPEKDAERNFIDQLPFGLITTIALAAVLAAITAITAVVLL